MNKLFYRYNIVIFLYFLSHLSRQTLCYRPNAIQPQKKTPSKKLDSALTSFLILKSYYSFVTYFHCVFFIDVKANLITRKKGFCLLEHSKEHPFSIPIHAYSVDTSKVLLPPDRCLVVARIRKDQSIKSHHDGISTDFKKVTFTHKFLHKFVHWPFIDLFMDFRTAE